jgi:photosystem II stability/assembly factor-like uncharacterized protein
MLPKRLLTIILTTVLAAMGAREARAQWVQTSLSKNNSPVYCFASKDSNLFTGTVYGVYHSTDTGTTWTSVNSGLMFPDYVQALLIKGNDLYAGHNGGGVSRSTNNGMTWTGGTDGTACVFALASIGSDILDGQEGVGPYAAPGIFLSTNNGINWLTRSKGMPIDSDFYQPPSIISFAVNDANLFAGTFDDGIFFSIDTGLNWNAMNGGLVRENGGDIIYSILATDSSLFAGTASGIYRRRIHDTAWTALNSGLPQNTSFLTLVQFGTTIFTGTDSGAILLSTNDGNSWINVSDGLVSPVNALAVFGTNLFVGTETSGVLYRPLSDFGISAVSEPPRASAVTIRSYPNPLSQSTTISFTSPSSGYADVTIVNALGMEVARLFSGELAAGEHRFIWNADGTSAPRGAVCNGMYQCLVRMNGSVESAGIIVLR